MGEVTTATIATTPKKTQLPPPFGPSVDSLCHPWFTTANLSYRFPISETSATGLCGTTGRMTWIVNICQHHQHTLPWHAAHAPLLPGTWASAARVPRITRTWRSGSWSRASTPCRWTPTRQLIVPAGASGISSCPQRGWQEWGVDC